MVITETIQKSMQRAQEDIQKNAKEYRQQYAEKMGNSQRDSYEQVGLGWQTISIAGCAKYN